MKLGQFFQRIARHAVVYGAGDLLGKMAGLLLIPLYTRALSLEEFGRLQVLLSFQTLGFMVLSLGQTATLMRYHTLAADDHERRQVITGTTLLVLGANLVALCVVYLGAPALAHRFLGGAELATLLRWLWISVLFRVLAELPMTLFRLREQSHRFAGANLLRLLTSSVVILYFVLVRRAGLPGVIWGEVIGAASFWLWLWPGFTRQLGRRPNLATFREYLRFGWPYVTTNLGAFALVSIDKLFLAAYGLVAVTGIYSLGGKLGTLINVVILAPFTMVFSPLMFRLVKEQPEREAKRLFSELLTWFAVLLFWAALFLIVFARDILRLAAPASYASAITVVPHLVLCFVAYGFYKHLQVGLSVTGHTKALATSFVAAAVINVAGNALLIPRFGMLGAAWATLAAYLAMTVMVGRAAQRHYPIRYGWGRIAVAFAYAALLALSAFAPASWPTALRLSAQAAAVAAFPLGLLLGGFLRPGEKAELAAVWGQLKTPRGASRESLPEASSES